MLLRAVLGRVRRGLPWLGSVTVYGGLFAGGDLAQQCMARPDLDWTQTARVATMAFGFHGNFNFLWLRLLERAFPGRSVGMVMRKLALDQTLSSPLNISVFYTGQEGVGFGMVWVGFREGGVGF